MVVLIFMIETHDSLSDVNLCHAVCWHYIFRLPQIIWTPGRVGTKKKCPVPGTTTQWKSLKTESSRAEPTQVGISGKELLVWLISSVWVGMSL